jgi:hypothetical protein
VTITNQHDAVSTAARAGFAGKGVFYFVLGLTAATLATNPGSNSDASGQGAINSLAQQPFGTALVIALALGLTGYAGFRFFRAFVPPADDYDLPEPVARGATAFRGLIYGGLAWLAWRQALTGRSGEGGGQTEQELTARLLELPFGVPLVVVGGIVIIGVGCYLGWQAVTLDPLEQTNLAGVSPGRRRVYEWVARGGSAGRALVYLLVGGFLIRAALQFDPSEGVGLDGALQEVAETPVGPFLLGLVGLGLVLYAGLMAIVAVHGQLRDMD